MQKDAPAFDFYPERFWFSVEGWTESEIARYFRLLCQQWMRDGLPDDRKQMNALARGKITDRVFEKFPLWPDGKRRNRKMEHERTGQRRRILESRFKQATLSWKRWHKDEPLPPYLLSIEAFEAHYNSAAASPATLPPDIPPDVPPDIPPHSRPSESPPLTTHHSPHSERERRREAAVELEGWIERIRTTYPRQGAQQDCRHAIRTAIDAARQTPEQILADVEECTKWIKILEPDANTACAWVPCAEKFFGGRQWTDPKKFQAMVVRREDAKSKGKPATVLKPAYTEEIQEL